MIPEEVTWLSSYKYPICEECIKNVEIKEVEKVFYG